MKRLLVGMSAAALIAFPAAAFAQHGNATHTPPPTSHATTTHGPTTQATHGNSAAAHSSTHGSSASATHGSSSGSHGSSATTHTSSKSSSSTTTTTSNTTSTSLTPVQQKLEKNTKLASKLQNLLPKGTNVITAAKGFRNLGQFVAAVHVSNNLGISFSKLKTDMVTKGMSLGQSIQDLKPSANATKEAETAEREADTDIRTSTTTTTTTTTSSTSLTPVQQKLQKNTKLASKLQNLLPNGTNVITAASGFRNFGQFVAAVHVSNNLGIPFSKLKADMVTRNMSLGQAIQDLKPSANVTTEVSTAEHEADTDIRTTTTTTTTATTRKHE